MMTMIPWNAADPIVDRLTHVLDEAERCGLRVTTLKVSHREMLVLLIAFDRYPIPAGFIASFQGVPLEACASLWPPCGPTPAAIAVDPHARSTGPVTPRD